MRKDPIIKTNSKPIEKCFSLLSQVFFIVTITLLWSDELFVFVINISLFFPFVFGVLGIIAGWFGIKGSVRISLLVINSLALAFYLIVFLIGTGGFRQP